MLRAFVLPALLVIPKICKMQTRGDELMIGNDTSKRAAPEVAQGNSEHVLFTKSLKKRVLRIQCQTGKALRRLAGKYLLSCRVGLAALSKGWGEIGGRSWVHGGQLPLSRGPLGSPGQQGRLLQISRDRERQGSGCVPIIHLHRQLRMLPGAYIIFHFNIALYTGCTYVCSIQ